MVKVGGEDGVPSDEGDGEMETSNPDGEVTARRLLCGLGVPVGEDPRFCPMGPSLVEGKGRARFVSSASGALQFPILRHLNRLTSMWLWNLRRGNPDILGASNPSSTTYLASSLGERRQSLVAEIVLADAGVLGQGLTATAAPPSGFGLLSRQMGGHSDYLIYARVVSPQH